MGNLGPMGIGIIVLNVLLSLRAFNNPVAFANGVFQVDRILQHREWQRILSSGFIHVSYNHLLFNMLTLFFFAGNLETSLGPLYFLLIYLGSLIGGNLFSLFIHRHNGLYRAVGASGAVSGVVFAAIAISPGMSLAFIFIPIPFPAWVYALGFVLYSIYGIRSQRDNIGHEAHLGGAIIGLLIALAIVPQAFALNTFPILVVLIPTLVFIILIIFKPDVLAIKQKYYQYYDYSKSKDRDESHLEEQREKTYEIDRILEKIQREGEDSLSDEERHILDNYGK